MTNAELLDRAVDEIVAGRSPNMVSLGAEEVGLAVRAARLASAARAVPASTGRADIRRHILTTALEERPRRRLSRWFVLVGSTVLLLGGGIAVASSKAVPGDALYSVRRGLSAVRVAVTFGNHARAVALLDRAEGTLNVAERLASSGHESKAENALRVFAGDLANARAEIAGIAEADRGDLSGRADALEARAKIVANSIETAEANNHSGEGGSGNLPSGKENGSPSGSSGPGSGQGQSGDEEENSGSGSSSSGGGGSSGDKGLSGSGSGSKHGSKHRGSDRDGHGGDD